MKKKGAEIEEGTVGRRKKEGKMRRKDLGEEENDQPICSVMMWRVGSKAGAGERIWWGCTTTVRPEPCPCSTPPPSFR